MKYSKREKKDGISQASISGTTERNWERLRTEPAGQNKETIEADISDATARNWERLCTEPAERLTARANKRRSTKRILPLEYIGNQGHIVFLQNMLAYIDENQIDIMSALYSLGINLMKKSHIYGKRNVTATLSEYSGIAMREELLAIDLPKGESDLLGLLYQSYLQEGRKNIQGSYFTPQKIARNMTKGFDFSNGESFFDPCCGSGAFLLSVPAKNPNQIFGIDNDEIAVFLAKINLLLKYRDFDFIPQIACMDYLLESPKKDNFHILEKTFDYVATNPPWGAISHAPDNICGITSRETFSCFFAKAFRQLKEKGVIRFLFPEAILNVKAHKDIRKFILDTAGLVSITTYGELFSGVTTRYVDIECNRKAEKDTFKVYTYGQALPTDDVKTIDVKTVYETDNLVFNLLSDDDVAIIRAVKSKGSYTLRDSTWALGIVTGDNKGKLFPEYHDGMEKIYTGKEIQPYSLRPARNYIRYDRDHLQQAAKEEIYRATEKLAYKFISSKLVFAYDDSASLFLNSANILIPKIPFMGIKTAMAFMNSSLFQFMYQKLFGEVKVLKGNLMELPFPKISKSDDETLASLVDEVLAGDLAKADAINQYIFSFYGLDDEQVAYVGKALQHPAP